MRNEANLLLDGVNDLKQVRHDLVHGCGVKMLPEERLQFMRFVYHEDGHSHVYPEYGLPDIIRADERAKELCEIAISMATRLVEMVENRARQIAARKAAIPLGSPK
jgi:hypothetical protein